MRLASRIAIVLLIAASPAHATSTILCRSTVSPTDGPSLSLVVGHGTAAGVTQAHFAHEGESFTTGVGSSAPMISQAWLDRASLRLDIVDANAVTRLLRLGTRRRGSGYAGILIHRGRTWRVRCEEAS